MRPGAEQNMMVEVNYRQGRDGTTLDAVVQDVYVCASMEFLLTVADIFLKANQQGFAQVPQPKSSSGDKKNINSSVTSKESCKLTMSLLIYLQEQNNIVIFDSKHMNCTFVTSLLHFVCQSNSLHKIPV